MSRAPEYTKRYPCPHCDVMKYGTSQLLAHIHAEHTDKPKVTTKSVPHRAIPWSLYRSLGIGFIVTVIYQIVENHHQGVMYGIEHGAMAMLLYTAIILWVTILFRR